MNTAGRRQKQARNHYRHMSPQTRPHYSIVSASKSANRLAALIRREKERQGRKKG